MNKKITHHLFRIAILMFLAHLAFPLFSSPKVEKKIDLKGFPEFVTKVMADWKVPDVAISVVKDSKVIYAEGFGFGNVEQGLKVTPRTLFAIGSCTKAFTATASASWSMRERSSGTSPSATTSLHSSSLIPSQAST